MARTYTKRNQSYWTGLKHKPIVGPNTEESVDWTVSMGSCDAGNVRAPSTGRRKNRVSTGPIGDVYSTIESLPSPIASKGGRLFIDDAIELCQKAYSSVALFRNTIEIMVEFSNAEVYLTGGNAVSRSFVEGWLRRINITKLVDTFFREYYRSGNVFLYKFLGAFSEEDIQKLRRSFAVQKKEIPIRYTIINPQYVAAPDGANFEDIRYERVLSKYEIKQLKNRRTEEDRAIYEALPSDVKRIIDGKNSLESSANIYVPIDERRLYAVFYKKQQYEAFAIPFGFPVLKDINYKEELKKIDQEISRNTQHIILLVTQGAPKDQYGNGVSQKAIDKLRELFTNLSVSKTVVSDFSTNAQYLVPEIKKILGKEKYEVIESDIRDGLMNIVTGDEKFANATIKTQIFLQRLNGGRNVFLSEFLQPEINALCRQMGFKAIPTAKFQTIDMRDQNAAAKVYTRLMEIGVLTPEQGMKAMQTGILPEDTSLGETQDRFVEDRKKGRFNPLLGGIPMFISPEAEANREFQKKYGKISGNQTKTQETVGNPGNPNSPNNGRPSTASISLAGLQESYRKISEFSNRVVEKVKSKYSIACLNDAQQESVLNLITNAISTASESEWDSRAEEILKDPAKELDIKVENEITKNVASIAREHGIDFYQAAVMHYARK